MAVGGRDREEKWERHYQCCVVLREGSGVSVECKVQEY